MLAADIVDHFTKTTDGQDIATHLASVGHKYATYNLTIKSFLVCNDLCAIRRYDDCVVGSAAHISV